MELKMIMCVCVFVCVRVCVCAGWPGGELGGWQDHQGDEEGGLGAGWRVGEGANDDKNLNHNCEKSMWILDQKCSEVKGALRRRRRCLSRPPTFGGWRHGEGCLLPAAQKSDRRTFSTISGNSWGLPIHLLRGFGIFSNEFFSGISSSIQGRTRQQALYSRQNPNRNLSLKI